MPRCASPPIITLTLESPDPRTMVAIGADGVTLAVSCPTSGSTAPRQLSSAIWKSPLSPARPSWCRCRCRTSMHRPTRFDVVSVMGSQFADAPQLANPDQVTCVRKTGSRPTSPAVTCMPNPAAWSRCYDPDDVSEGTRLRADQGFAGAAAAGRNHPLARRARLAQPWPSRAMRVAHVRGLLRNPDCLERRRWADRRNGAAL